MMIEAKALDFPLTDAILSHVRTRIGRALRPAGRVAGGVTVRLHDVNAVRGGVDKRCQVIMALPQRRVIVAEARDEDLYASVDRAAARLRRALVRAMRRRRAVKRRKHRLAQRSAGD